MKIYQVSVASKVLQFCCNLHLFSFSGSMFHITGFSAQIWRETLIPEFHFLSLKI